MDENKEVLIFKRKDRDEIYKYVQIVKVNNNIPLIVKGPIKTRIRRDNDSIYVNSPSREIKKWFSPRF